MFGTLGFSYIGLIFLCFPFIPNLIWSQNRPVDDIKLKENRILLLLERAGQVLVTVLVLIFKDYNPNGFGAWTCWLIAAAVFMLLYLLCWTRYFKGNHVIMDFYRSFLGVPLPLAVLPVAAVICIAVYGRVLSLGIASVILGIGHIGIHMQYWKEIKRRTA